MFKKINRILRKPLLTLKMANRRKEDKRRYDEAIYAACHGLDDMRAAI